MLRRKIEISQRTYEDLCEMTPKEETFDDTINFLIKYYWDNEEFGDEDAEYYNRQIEKFENGNYGDVTKVSIKDLNCTF